MRSAWVPRVLLVLAIAALWLVPHRGLDFPLSLAAHLGATAAYVWLVVLVLRERYRPGFLEAFGFALGLRLIVLPLGPALSDDVYRYLYEGRLVLEGLNPFLNAPDSLAGVPLRDGYWELINNKSIPAAYPPAVQIALAGAVLVHPHPLGVSAMFGAFDLGTFVLLWRWLPLLELPRERAIIHGYCPLMIVEFAAEGHSDSLAIFFLVGSLFAATRGRAALAGGLLAVATAGKLMPIVFLPFVWRKTGGGRRAPLAFAAVLAALYAPFVPWDAPLELFRGTAEYAVRWRSNDTLFSLVYAITELVSGLGLLGAIEVQLAAKIPVVVGGLWLLGWMWQRRWPPERAALGFSVYFVAAAPTVHPWYVGFLVPFLAVWPNVAWIAFSGTVFLAYRVLPGWLTEGRWEESGAVKALAYSTFYLGIAYEFVRVRRSRRAAADYSRKNGPSGAEP